MRNKRLPPTAADRRRFLLRPVVGSLLALALPGVPLLARAGGHAASAEATAYPPVVEGALLQFPQDFGAHPQFRTEWWYVTGWLREAGGGTGRHWQGAGEGGAEGRAGGYGFQLTFFRVRTRIGEDNPSRFAPRQLILAHAAIADPSIGRLRHAERSARAYPGLVEAGEGRTSVRVDDWLLEGGDTVLAPYRTNIETDEFGFELVFEPGRAPVLNGKQGFSQKAPDPLNASYYYSRPQMMVGGRMRTGGTVREVEGHAWLDHEWSSEILPEGARGWDWVGINLYGGGGLMAFQMRDGEGRALWHAGTLSEEDGASRIHGPDELRFTPLRHWQSPRTGIRYPVEWEIELAGRRLRLRPLIDDQELDSRASTGAIYWEDAVRLFELGAADEARAIGEGYLEMTGYAERLAM